MPFSQSTITGLLPIQLRGPQAFVSWTSSSPAGTWFQVYVNQRLAWFGQRTWTWLPVPSGPARIDVGTVAAGEQTTDFAGSLYGQGGYGYGLYGYPLPPAPARRVTLSWTSGRYLGADLAGFRVYSSGSPGGYGTGPYGDGNYGLATVDYATPLATIAAYPAGIPTDGYGLGTYGAGGYGYVPGSWSWTSGPLDAGTWTFAIVPYDAAGNAGTAMTTTAVVAGPPTPPAYFAGTTTRLKYSLSGYGGGTYGSGGYSEPLVTLTWNPSTP